MSLSNAFESEYSTDKKKIRTAVICYGTHGSERDPIAAGMEWEEIPSYEPHTFKLRTLQTNVAADEENKRYIDYDLQDFFTLARLYGPPPYEGECYELRRAKEIADELGCKITDTEGVDLLIDMHTTEANMHRTINISRWNPFLYDLCSHLVKTMGPEIRILWTPMERDECPFLDSLSHSGITLELGDCKRHEENQGVKEAFTDLLAEIMMFADAYNEGSAEKGTPFPVYKDIGVQQFPGPGWDVADTFRGTDYMPLKKGQVLFTHPEEEDIKWEGESGVIYACFIDEPEYDCEEEDYEAFDLCFLDPKFKMM